MPIEKTSNECLTCEEIERRKLEYIKEHRSELEKKYAGQTVAFLPEGDSVTVFASGKGNFPSVHYNVLKEMAKKFNGEFETKRKQLDYYHFDLLDS
ncbi:MAG: hypothetical protein V1678_01640 [Candidatus Aenigmatarchaeota archaeon]